MSNSKRVRIIPVDGKLVTDTQQLSKYFDQNFCSVFQPTGTEVDDEQAIVGSELGPWYGFRYVFHEINTI